MNEFFYLNRFKNKWIKEILYYFYILRFTIYDLLFLLLWKRVISNLHLYLLARAGPYLGSISTYLRSAFTLVDPKSAKRQTTHLHILHFGYFWAKKLLIKCWWNWHLVPWPSADPWVKSILKIWDCSKENLLHLAQTNICWCNHCGTA